MTESAPVNQACSAVIRDAKLYFIFPFVRSRNLTCLSKVRRQMDDLTLADLNHTLGVRLSDNQRAKASLPAAKVWKEQPFTLDKSYFHDFVQSIFGNTEVGKKSMMNPGTKSLAPFTLSDEARNLLGGQYGKRGQGLCIGLSKAGGRRLREAGYVPESFEVKGKKQAYLRFDIESCHCLFFGTGVGMLLIEVDVLRRISGDQAPPLEYLLEITNQLCRCDYWSKALERLACWVHQDTASRGTEFEETTVLHGIGQVAAALLGEKTECSSAPSSIIPIHWEKVSIFCGLKTSKFHTAKDRELACIRLARKETSDYIPNIMAVQDAFYQPFEYVTHAASIEGGVLLVETEDSDSTPVYVKNFLNNSTARAYLPLMLWAMHEYLFLTELSKLASGWIDFRKTTEADTVVLREFRARIYNYRFHFRFSHASAISMHNDVFRLWRNTFDLSTILTEVDQDVAETENNLEQFYTEKAHRKQENSRVIFGLFVAIAGTVISIPDWIDKKWRDILPLECGNRKDWFCSDFSLHNIIVALFLAAALGLGVFAAKLLIDGIRRHRKNKKARARLEV